MIHLRWLAALLSIVSINVQAEPLYWLASKGDTQYMLLGSIHIGDQSMYPLPDTVLHFFNQSSALIVEADISKATKINYSPNSQTTSQLINKSQYQALQKLSEELQLNPTTLEQSPPWISALTIQTRIFQKLGYSADFGVDQQLINLAQQKQLPILGLETVQDQINAISQIPNSGLELLTSSLNDTSKNSNDARCMVESWKVGDEKNLSLFVETTEMSQEMSTRLEIERNNNWIKKLTSDSFLPTKKGKYLIVVGTLHLIGEQNLIMQLEQHGFTVIKRQGQGKTACKFS